MLEIYNHLAVFGILFVCMIFFIAIADEDLGHTQIIDAFKFSLFIAAICEILAWSIWYLNGGAV